MKRILVYFAIGLALWSLGFSIGLLPDGDVTVEDGVRLPELRSPPISFGELLSHNLKVLLILVSGIVCGGLTTAITIAFNGFIIGVLVHKGLQSGIKEGHMLLALAPHGIPEVIGLLLASALGLYGWRVLRFFLGLEDRAPFRPSLKPFLLTIGVALLLILLAGWIEVHVTLPLIEGQWARDH